VARNRYGWEKRAKELARKQKHQEKMKRRQTKSQTAVTEEAAKTEETEGQPSIFNEPLIRES
jgi:hypothetical protein